MHDTVRCSYLTLRPFLWSLCLCFRAFFFSECPLLVSLPLSLLSLSSDDELELSFSFLGLPFSLSGSLPFLGLSSLSARLGLFFLPCSCCFCPLSGNAWEWWWCLWWGPCCLCSCPSLGFNGGEFGEDLFLPCLVAICFRLSNRVLDNCSLKSLVETLDDCDEDKELKEEEEVLLCCPFLSRDILVRKSSAALLCI